LLLSGASYRGARLNAVSLPQPHDESGKAMGSRAASEAEGNPSVSSFCFLPLSKERFMESNTTQTNGIGAGAGANTGAGNGTTAGTDKGAAAGSQAIKDKISQAAQAAKGMFNDAKGNQQQSAASLRSDLSSMKNDLDALVNRAPSMSDDELFQAHAQLMAKFSTVRHAAKGIANEASRQINRGMETTTGYVKDKPMQSVAVAVGTGLLLGMLFKRR
jgi:ElaB/YqjD/DUF883 family membrane-anchored ribosome-binding protein